MGSRSTINHLWGGGVVGVGGQVVKVYCFGVVFMLEDMLLGSNTHSFPSHTNSKMNVVSTLNSPVACGSRGAKGALEQKGGAANTSPQLVALRLGGILEAAWRDATPGNSL